MTYTHGSQNTRTVEETIYSVLRDIIKENPKAKPEKLQQLWTDEVVHEPELCRQMAEQLYAQVLQAVERSTKPKGKRRRMTKEEKQASLHKYYRKNVYAYLMPNGKRLGDCTCAEVVAMGKGSEALTNLAKSGSPDELMRKQFSMKQIRKAWSA